MTLCIPCPPLVRHVARAVRRRVWHAVRHPVHHAARHPGKAVIFACCVGSLGPIGHAVPTPASAPHAVYAPAPLSASQGWPDLPGWSVAGGPLSGARVMPIPVYGDAPRPQFLDTQPNIIGAPPRVRQTSVPEPSAAALLALPLVGLAAIAHARKNTPRENV